MRSLALAALLVAVAPGIVAAQGGVGVPSFLVYHATGGPEPDPLASGLYEMPEADRLPATFFDRAARADTAPENAPESAPAHYREMERILSERETMGAPRLALAARIDADVLHANLSTSANGTIQLVVFEHGAPLGGVPQPYVARFSTDPSSVLADTPHAMDVRLDPAWDVAHLGAVAILRENGAVVQSVTWIAGEGGESVQTAKGVLVEHVTASWCDPCKPADDAFALLASQRGAGGVLSSGDITYFRAPGLAFYGGLALGAIAAIAIVGRRRAA